MKKIIAAIVYLYWVTIVPAHIVTYGRIHWPENFHPDKVSWVENYEVLGSMWVIVNWVIGMIILINYYGNKS